MSTRNAAAQAVSRRIMLRGVATAGAVGAAVPVLAACGSGGDETDTADGGAEDNGSDGGGSDSGGDSGEAPEKESGAALTTTAEVAVGSGLLLKEEKVVVCQPEAGTFKAFSSVCTHKGCDVSEFAKDTITCKCHGSQFSTTDGSVKGGPAQKPLPEVKITVDGDKITRA